MSSVNAPGTEPNVILNYIGAFCTGEEYRLCDHIIDVVVNGVTAWQGKTPDTIVGNMLLPLVSYLVYVWY